MRIAPLVAGIVLASCGTLTTQLGSRYETSELHGNDESQLNQVYSGALHAYLEAGRVLRDDGLSPVSRLGWFLFHLVDFPLSAVTDTLFLPVTIPKQLARGPLYDTTTVVRDDAPIPEDLLTPPVDPVAQGPTTFVERYPSGSTRAEGLVQEGRPVGVWTWFYESGQIEKRGELVDGVPTGTWEFWHDNGEKAGEGGFRAGQAEGQWRMWNPDGSVDEALSGTYANGKKLG